MARIRHLAIVTDNRERLVKFYTTAFGMKVIDGVGPAIYLSDGYLNLAIIQKRGNYKEGLYHFGFEVENIEELRPVCKELGAKTDIQKRPANREAEYRVARSGRHAYRSLTARVAGLTFFVAAVRPPFAEVAEKVGIASGAA